jgi:hypothetical protein
MVCSYQKPEPWQPSHQSSMPPDVPSPEECRDEATLTRERAAATDDEYSKKLWVAEAEVLLPLHGSFFANASTAGSGQKPDSHTDRRGPLRGRCARLLHMDEGKARPRVRPGLSEGSDRVHVVMHVPFAHDFP